MAKTVWLSTHKNADGDGLGSEVAAYYALKSLGINVQIVHNDQTPRRYHFLTKDIEILSSSKFPRLAFSDQDIVLIFDTHDPLLCAPLFGFLQERAIKTHFIDHHVPVKQDLQNVTYHIDESACCTGEMVYSLIKKLMIPVNAKIATPLYASLIFDTQNFKFIRGSSRPFLMAAELMAAGAEHLNIQKNLYDNWSVQKMDCLSALIKSVIYKNSNKIAIIKITKKTLDQYHLEADDVSDFVDLFMGIQSLDAAIVIREDAVNYHKLSFRSRSHEILSWAQSFNGGGHLYSAGAWVSESAEHIEERLDTLINSRFDILA